MSGSCWAVVEDTEADMQSLSSAGSFSSLDHSLFCYQDDEKDPSSSPASLLPCSSPPHTPGKPWEHFPSEPEFLGTCHFLSDFQTTQRPFLAGPEGLTMRNLWTPVCECENCSDSFQCKCLLPSPMGPYPSSAATPAASQGQLPPPQTICIWHRWRLFWFFLPRPSPEPSLSVARSL